MLASCSKPEVAADLALRFKPLRNTDAITHIENPKTSTGTLQFVRQRHGGITPPDVCIALSMLDIEALARRSEGARI